VSEDPPRMKFQIIIDRFDRRGQKLLRKIAKSGVPQVVIIVAYMDPAVAGGLARAYGARIKKVDE